MEVSDSASALGLARASVRSRVRVSIVISKGSLEGVYPGLIMANGARMEGIEANLFDKAMEGLDIPPIPEFIEMISDSGAGLYACKASVDMFKLTRADFIDQVQEIITVGEFYQKAGGGQIIFT